MMRWLPPRPALFAQFPRLRTPAKHWPVFPQNAREKYPHLAGDLADLAGTVEKPFREADLEAQARQNTHRRQQVVVLIGSVVLTALAAVQALLPDERWPGVAVTVLAAALLCSSRLARELNTLGDFLSARTKAERYRSLNFEYLSRTGPYAGPDRRAALHTAVIDIDAGREPG